MGVHERMPGSAWVCAWAYRWARVDASGRMRDCTWAYMGMSVRPYARAWACIMQAHGSPRIGETARTQREDSTTARPREG